MFFVVVVAILMKSPHFVSFHPIFIKLSLKCPIQELTALVSFT